MKKIILLFIVMIYSVWLNAQSFSFLSYSTAEGLPQSQVTAITQDNQGYLWVGTLSGLAKFNGRKFTNYSINDGLLTNLITTLYSTKNELWIGHEGGISLFKNNTFQSWSLAEEDKNVQVSEITSFNDKTIITTNGAGIYILSNKKLIKYQLPTPESNRCRSAVVANNKLFIGTLDGLYITKNFDRFEKVKSLATKNISHLSKCGTIVYASTYGEGFFSSTNDFKSVDSFPLMIPNFKINHHFVDANGKIWLSSLSGNVIRYKRGNNQLFLSEKNGLPTSIIRCVFEDKDGIIWLGSEGRGLMRFNSEKIVYYNKKNNFPSDFVVSLFPYSKHELLVGTYDQGLYLLNLADKSTQPIPTGNELLNKTIWSIDKDEFGQIWIASENGFTPLNNLKSNKTTYYLNEKNLKSTVIEKYNEKRLIVGGASGIGWIYQHQLHPINLNIDFAKKVGTVRDFQRYNGTVLIGADKGLFTFNPTTNQIKKIKACKFGVKSLAIDLNNRIWIGTENGIFTYTSKEFKAQKLGVSNSYLYINFISSYKNLLYLGTNNGIYLVDPQKNKPKIVYHLGINEGLFNLETNINSAFVINKDLWFGTSEGLHQFHIDRFEVAEEISNKPLLNIKEVMINYKPIAQDASEVKYTSKGEISAIKVSYNRNNLILGLDALYFPDPKNINYQFWLEGMDENWSPVSENPSVILSNIDDGAYKLHIRAKSEMGSYSKEHIIQLIVTPPYWRTWWFYSIIGFFILVVIRIYFNVQIRRERDKNERENLVDRTRLLALEQQSLNASMNRHFIFNALNSIQYFINTQDRLSANRYLTAFAKLIRKNLDSAAENDNQVTLEQEIERLNLYLSLEAMRFKDRFDYDIKCINIDPEQIIVPAMLLQPFVENSIIHGILPNETQKGNIEITIKSNGFYIEICIDDNGIGIENSLSKKERINGDHKSQGMEITSKRIDLIRKMWKKDYELYGPFQMNNLDNTIKGTRVLIKIPLDDE